MSEGLGQSQSIQPSLAFSKDSETVKSLALKVPEILAPVGGREQFFAALNSGADAVFLGLKQFNARSRAENFTIDELKTLVPLAHRYGMKVLVTFNILIKDEELSDVIAVLASLEEIGVDAVIVQDIGVARIARQHFPGLKLHASTQMAIHNLAGVLEAARHGFKRVVMARELTAEEIKRISRAVDVELEVFCHGSLCYSYSGLCFFSGASDARSGNRGECAYTCREPYKVISEPGHGFLFSMRDLDTSHKLDQMIAAGVDTLKIEGRKKDAQYVSSVVRLYRKKLDQLFGRPTLRDNAPPLAKLNLPEEKSLRRDLQLSFQRQTTSFFFEGRYHENVIDLNNASHHGIRVGVIDEIKGDLVKVNLQEEVERFDGLKIISAKKLYHAKPQDGNQVHTELRGLARRYENRETAFSLRDMSLKGRKIFKADAGMRVDIKLPAQMSGIEVGDVVFKARSSDLRVRVEKISGAPVDERLRPLIPVKTSVTARQLDDGGVKLTVELARYGEVLRSAGLTLENLQLREKGDLANDLKDIFHIFGDEGVYSGEFSFALSKNYFIPRAVLKELKRELSAALADTIEKLHSKHATSATQALGEGIGQNALDEETSYSVKIDRTEYLPWIEQLAQKQTLLEVVFEPKKMFLPDVKPESFLDALKDFKLRTGISVRFAFPTVIRAWDEPVLKLWFKAAHEAGFDRFEVGNPGALELIRQWGLPATNLTSDFMLYAMNREAVKQWRDEGVSRIALSIEDDAVDLAHLLSHWPNGVRPEAILYKDTPLFVAEACSLTALHNGCPSSKVCGYRTLEIENSKGERFFVGHEGCKTIVYGASPFSLSGRRRELEKLGVRHFRLDFLTRNYERDQFFDVVEKVISDQIIAGSHEANYGGRLK